MNNFCTFHFAHGVLFCQYENMQGYIVIINWDKTTHMTCGYAVTFNEHYVINFHIV